MIRTTHDPSVMKAALRETRYWLPEAWEGFEEAAPALEVALRALDRVGFSDYWRTMALPRIQKRIAQLSPDLPKYDIVPQIESYLGFPLPSRAITVYVLAYSEPHGSRVTGLRFITHLSYSFDFVLHNAIHESMHPPYDAADPRMKGAIDVLRRDPLVVDKVAHHDPSFGYNTPDELIEEDSVEALEQIVSEQYGLGRYARLYWYRQDQGIHVLAPVIYQRYKEELRQHPEPYSRWFVKAVANGELQGAVLRSALSMLFFGFR